jgi:hypothetical protein
MLGLHDRTEFAEEIVGPLVQRALDLPARQLGERPAGGRPHHVVDLRRGCVIARQQRELDLPAQRTDPSARALKLITRRASSCSLAECARTS